MTDTAHHILDPPGQGKIGKQIQLPLSKAVEISVKSLRVRFWRSMLTVASIILAIAFLTFVWASNRVQSAVAIGMRPDAAKVAVVAQQVDDVWKPFERVLADRFTARRGDYQKALQNLYDGSTASFKSFCRESETHRLENKRVDLSKLPTTPEITPEVIGRLAEAARGIELTPDLDGWVTERELRDPQTGAVTGVYRTDASLALAGVKGVVQAEVNRFNRLQLALQRQDIQPETPVAELEKISPTVLWLIIISLMVCGVGITNAMLMSVTERFREIGTMKCLGALDSFIVKLFLLESTFQGVAGTCFGVAIGFAMMILSSLWSFGSATRHYFPGGQVLAIIVYALLIGSGLSILSAVFPALRAARMAPVEAMRVEE